MSTGNHCTMCSHREEHIRNTEPGHIITSLSDIFYNNGWLTGTGGSMSIRQNDKVYLAPSGVHKERMLPEDLYTLTVSGEVITSPKNSSYKLSQCTPLFFAIYQLRNASSVIHTHSLNAVLTTLILEKKKEKIWRITHQEMIKGIRVGDTKESYKYYDTIEVPIIANTPEEKDLEADIRQALIDYPNANAILVERHGIYVWGDSWEKAKSMLECYDYLLNLTVEMHKLGLSWDSDPATSLYTQCSDRRYN